MLLYDTYFLLTKDGGENFGIAWFLTDNTLNIGIEIFMNNYEIEIIETNFKIKTQTILETGASGDFNSYRITIKAESIIVVQKY